eukprot:TRINITY_DN4262_c0_g1_i2.p1 TRINITY_DN4262_c0_g1~~TRINITY_DN4262_c0_g1_i2.p1  ORF type:complete len:250 (+),score=45.23 TRINITY_DN4262_c0_g1_i2:36-785(+)
MTTWDIDSCKYTLKVTTDKLELDVFDKKTKDAWASGEIDEKSAGTIIEGLWPDAIPTLSGMIKDSFDKVVGVTYNISRKEDDKEMVISVSLYRQTRKFTLFLKKKEVDEVGRLKQIVTELKDQISILTSSKTDKVLWAQNTEGIVLEAVVETARINKLPPGKWLVEISFMVNSATPHWYPGMTQDITFSLMKNTTQISCYATQCTPKSNRIVDRYIVDSAGESICLRFSASPRPPPVIKNIILTATKIG